ncbi:MAG: hypothetical protein Q4E13_02930 [Clostridia bacterium]|nr:hypothetical protein [Clostridia bacterium]
MIKAMFLDLDGMLMNSALRCCREGGIRLFVAMARPPLLAKLPFALLPVEAER